jgi:hypothetical protein
LLTTKSRLKPLLAEARRNGLVFDYLDAGELLSKLPGGREALTPYVPISGSANGAAATP